MIKCKAYMMYITLLVRYFRFYIMFRHYYYLLFQSQLHFIKYFWNTKYIFNNKPHYLKKYFFEVILLYFLKAVRFLFPLNKGKLKVLPKVPWHISQWSYQASSWIFYIFRNTSKTKIEHPNVEAGIR